MFRVKYLYNKTTALAVVFLCLAQNIWSQENSINTAVENQQPEQLVYLALSDEFGVPQHEPLEIFNCTDKVYSVVELHDYPRDRYQLSVRWFDPAGTVREHTRYDFTVREPSTRLWAWLSLSRGFGGGMLQFINPAAGLEDFIGIWKIEVNINGKNIGDGSFEVSC